MTFRVLLSAILLTLASSPLRAQILPFSIAFEGRAGYAVPVGDFAGSEDGFGADAGMAYSAGGAIFPFANFGIFGAYQFSDFGCDECADVGLDDRITTEGLEAGLHVSVPTPLIPIDPWARAGVLYQTVGFSGFDDEVTSSSGTGFVAGVGLTLTPFPLVQINPAIRYYALPAEFDFDIVPDRSLDVTAISIDIGAAVRF